MPCGKGLNSWLSFVMSNCEFVTFPLVSSVRCGTWLYRFLIFAIFLTLIAYLLNGVIGVGPVCARYHHQRPPELGCESWTQTEWILQRHLPRFHTKGYQTRVVFWWLFAKLTFRNNSFRNTIKVSNCLDTDQDPCSDLGPNWLQRVSADDKICCQQGNS